MNYKYLFIAILVLTAILRFVAIDRSLDGDEILTMLAAEKSPAQMIDYIIKEDAHPPLTYFLLHYWTKVSASEVWIRLFFVMFGVLGAWFIYLLADALFDKKVACLSMFFYAISPELIWSSQYVRSYIIATSFTILATYFMVRLLSDKFLKRDIAGYVLSTLICLYSWYISVLFIAAQNVYVFFNIKTHKKSLKPWIISQFLVVGGFLFWMRSFFTQFFKISNHAEVVLKEGFYLGGIHIGGVIRSLLGVFSLDPEFMTHRPFSKVVDIKWLILSALVIGVLFFSYWIVGMIRIKKAKTSVLNEWFLTTLMFIPFLLANFAHNYQGIYLSGDYLQASSVYFLIFTAFFVVATKKRYFKYLIVGLIVLVFTSRYGQIYSAGEQWKEVTTYIDSNSTNKDCVVFVQAGKDPYGYYKQSVLPEFRVKDFIIDDNDNFNMLFARLSTFDRVWVIGAHDHFGIDQSEKINFFNRIENSCTLKNNKQFSGIKLFLYTKDNIL